MLVHREELAEQAYQKLSTSNKGLKIGKEGWGESSWSGDRIVIASVPAVGREGSTRLARFRPEEFDAIVVDEAHHAVASSYMRIFEHFGVASKWQNILLLGVTATPVRADGRGLDKVFQKIVYTLPLLKSIEDGWLCDLHGYRVRTTISLDAVSERGGDFAESELSREINNTARNELIVKSWFKMAQNRRTLVFCIDIQHGKDLAQQFRLSGVKADCVWGTDPERAQKLERYKRGEICVLTNCGVLTEGYDDWRISCVILARPTLSQLLFVQMIGRGTRIPDGVRNLLEVPTHQATKRNCFIIDVVDNTKQHRVVSLPTIFGLANDYDFRGDSVTKRSRRDQERGHAEEAGPAVAQAYQIASTIETVDLFAPKWKDDVLNRSVLQWFRSGSSFLLPLPGKDHITVTNGNGWVAHGELEGQKFRSGALATLPEALGYSERMLNYLGRKLSEELRREDQSRNETMTPIQERLLSVLTTDGPTARLSRQEAGLEIAKAFARKRDVVPWEKPSSLDAANTSRKDEWVLKSSFKYTAQHVPQWTDPLFAGSFLRWYDTNSGGLTLPLPFLGGISIVRHTDNTKHVRQSDNRWQLIGDVDGILLPPIDAKYLAEAVMLAEESMRKRGNELLYHLSQDKENRGEVSSIQKQLISNLLPSTDDIPLRNAEEAQEFIESMYAYQFNPSLYPQPSYSLEGKVRYINHRNLFKGQFKTQP